MTTDHGGSFQIASNPKSTIASPKSSGLRTLPVQIGSYNADSNNPTTTAFTPEMAPRTRLLRPSRDQKGRTPHTSKNDGMYMAMSVTSPPIHGCRNTGSRVPVPVTDAPRYAANVNSGPGTAWAAPYPATN